MISRFFIGLLLVMEGCNSISNSQLKMASPSCLPRGGKPKNDEIHVIVNVGSGKVLDLRQMSLKKTPPAIQWTFHSGENQEFVLHDLGRGYYTIKAAHSGLFLDFADNSNEAGASIQQRLANDRSNQNWQLASAGNDQYRIVSGRSQQVLSIEGDSKENGAEVVQKNDQGSPFQRWMLVTRETYNNHSCGAEDSADGFAVGTTGGGAVPAVKASNCKELTKLLESEEPASITIDQAIDCRQTPVSQSACAISCGKSEPEKFSYRIPVPGQTCIDLGNSTNDTVQKSRNDKRIRVKSNKTIRGTRSGARLIGATLDMSGSQNIIVRNIGIENVNPDLVEGGDGITLAHSSRIWIDHVEFNLISDGHVDMSNSQNITLSYNHFLGVNPAVCGNQHHYTHLVQDSQVTFHHNFWDTASGRNPKLIGSATRAHLYNNLWKDITYFSIGALDGAQAKVEGNIFDNSSKPHWNDGGTGFIEALPGLNRYLGRSAETKEQKDNTGKVFADLVLYPYKLDTLDKVQSELIKEVGPH